MGTTEELARYIVETNYEDLPAEVVAAAKIGILDGVANLLAGSTQPGAKLVSDYTQELGGNPVSSVIGYGFKTNPLNAAFANGVSGHCLDFELQGQPSSHIRMACENRSWGYDRIQGSLKHLGYTISDQTVGNILKRHGIPSAPERKKTVSVTS